MTNTPNVRFLVSVSCISCCCVLNLVVLIFSGLDLCPEDKAPNRPWQWQLSAVLPLSGMNFCTLPSSSSSGFLFGLLLSFTFAECPPFLPHHNSSSSWIWHWIPLTLFYPVFCRVLCWSQSFWPWLAVLVCFSLVVSQSIFSFFLCVLFVRFSLFLSMFAPFYVVGC